MINVEQLNPVNPGLVEQFEVFSRHFVASFDVNLAGGFVDQVIGRIATEDFVCRDQQVGQAVLGCLVGGAGRNLLAVGKHDLAGFGVDNVVHRLLTAPVFRLERDDPATLAAHKRNAVIEVVQDFFAGQAQRVQQRRYRQLTLAIDTDVDDVLGVEFEIEP